MILFHQAKSIIKPPVRAKYFKNPLDKTKDFLYLCGVNNCYHARNFKILWNHNIYVVEGS